LGAGDRAKNAAEQPGAQPQGETQPRRIALARGDRGGGQAAVERKRQSDKARSKKCNAIHGLPLAVLYS